MLVEVDTVDKMPRMLPAAVERSQIDILANLTITQALNKPVHWVGPDVLGSDTPSTKDTVSIRS